VPGVRARRTRFPEHTVDSADCGKTPGQAANQPRIEPTIEPCPPQSSTSGAFRRPGAALSRQPLKLLAVVCPRPTRGMDKRCAAQRLHQGGGDRRSGHWERRQRLSRPLCRLRFAARQPAYNWSVPITTFDIKGSQAVGARLLRLRYRLPVRQTGTADCCVGFRR
jgi:hypothetical protein